jgi:hypothetical protein
LLSCREVTVLLKGLLVVEDEVGAGVGRDTSHLFDSRL